MSLRPVSGIPHRLRGAGLLALAAGLGACAGPANVPADGLGYYAQSLRGHLDVMQRARPLADWLADPATPPALRQRLQLARQAVPRLDFERLSAQGWQPLPLPELPFADGGFATVNGRAQVAVPGLGLPRYLPPYESAQSAPDLAQRYPLAMISPPARHFLNSSFVNVKSLRSIEGEPLLELHPLDATARGIQDGAMVRVFNDRGSYLCKAAVLTRARPGVVNGLGVWWRKLGRRAAMSMK